jgi:hypothetical protein
MVSFSSIFEGLLDLILELALLSEVLLDFLTTVMNGGTLHAIPFLYL